MTSNLHVDSLDDVPGRQPSVVGTPSHGGARALVQAMGKNSRAIDNDATASTPLSCVYGACIQ